jgi:hypothetical protein
VKGRNPEGITVEETSTPSTWVVQVAAHTTSPEEVRKSLEHELGTALTVAPYPE